MYTLEMIKKELNRLSASVGDEFNIPVIINGRLTRTLGRVIQNTYKGYCESERIEFSKQFLETSTNDNINQVIAHEWAHYYATKTTGEYHGHDNYFKSICAKVGCKEDKTQTKVDRIVNEEQIYKYTIHCPTCNKIIGKYMKMCGTLKYINQYTCKHCGKGGLFYNQNW